jgi:phosphatidylinositol-3-phosphatase
MRRPNYLEVVGGSNFGVHTDNYPDWHNFSCLPNLATGLVATDNPASGSEQHRRHSFDPGRQQRPGNHHCRSARHSGEDVEVVSGKPATVNYADGFYSNLTNFANIKPVLTPPLSPNDVVFLYAVKHNPFAYFRSIQEANEPGSDLTNIVGFDGAKGLYAGLAAGSVPTFSFIAPNQCNDQHGRGNAGPYCNFDPNDDGTQAGLNPALLQRGDVAVKQIVTGTKTTTAFRLPSTRS